MAAPTRTPTRTTRKPLEPRPAATSARAKAGPSAGSKTAFVNQLAQDLGCSKRQAVDILNTISADLQQTLKETGRLSWPPLGTFKTRRRAAREGRNPQTGAKLKIQARTTIVLQPSRQTLKALN